MKLQSLFKKIPKRFFDYLAGGLLLFLIAGAVWLSLKKEENPERLKIIEAMKQGEFEFSFQDIFEKKHQFKSFKGKVVLVNLWATWCPPCVDEIPALLRLAAMLPKELIVLAITDEEKMEVKNFFNAFEKPEKNFIIGFHSEMKKKFSLTGLPESYLFDKQGRMITKAIGQKKWDAPEWQNLITNLSQENQK